MNQRTTRTPAHARDIDGKEIVLIPLANHSEPAKILREDFETLSAAGYTQNWTFNARASGPGARRYVRCAAHDRKGNLTRVARLVLNTPRGRVVKYRDGNRLNLRRDNLLLSAGCAPGATMKDESPDAAA